MLLPPSPDYKDEILAEQEMLGDGLNNKKFGLFPKERETVACPKDVAIYKKEMSDWDVVQKLFKLEMDQYDKDEQEKLRMKSSIELTMLGISTKA